MQFTDFVIKQVIQFGLDDFELTRQMDVQLNERSIHSGYAINGDKCTPCNENEGDLEVWWRFNVEWVTEMEQIFLKFSQFGQLKKWEINISSFNIQRNDERWRCTDWLQGQRHLLSFLC